MSRLLNRALLTLCLHQHAAAPPPTPPVQIEAPAAPIAQSETARPQPGLMVADLGLRLAPAGAADGVVIAAVEPGGVAAVAGLETGDVITEINFFGVNDPRHAAAWLSDRHKELAVVFLKHGAGRPQLTFFEPAGGEAAAND